MFSSVGVLAVIGIGAGVSHVSVVTADFLGDRQAVQCERGADQSWVEVQNERTIGIRQKGYLPCLWFGIICSLYFLSMVNFFSLKG